MENWRLPFYHIAAERMAVTGSPSGLFWDNLPPAAPILDSSLWPDTSDYARDHWHLEPSVSMSQELHPEQQTLFSARGYSSFRYGNLIVRNVLDVKESYLDDPYYVWKKDRFAAGRIEEAYIQYTGEHAFARLGRTKRQWGPFIDRSILLSNNPFAYDAFEWGIWTSFLEFRHIFAMINSKTTSSSKPLVNDGNVDRYDRYLVGHALNFMFGQWASIGVSETEVFTRKQGFPDLTYLNPVSVYSVINTNNEGNGNLMLGFQGWAHPFYKPVTLKGQVVFDDFQVDNEDSSDLEPTHWAMDVGAYWNDPLPIALSHHVSLEYQYLSRWMYTVANNNTRRGERYTYNGRSLGVQDIDGDKVKMGFTVLGKNYWMAKLGGGIERRDTNTVTTEWLNGNKGWLGYREETPLSERPSLKTTVDLTLEGTGYFRDYATVNLMVANRWIKENPNDDFAYDPQIRLEFSVHYSDFFLFW
ncbi:MAG: hypothetical protein ACLFSB_08285 [Chitinispirillaceae bacterium]